jgi:hypothetical protein
MRGTAAMSAFLILFDGFLGVAALVDFIVQVPKLTEMWRVARRHFREWRLSRRDEW